MKSKLSYILLLVLLVSCKTQYVEIPVESVRTEYRDRLVRDSIFMSDSVYLHVFQKGDTIYKEKYKYKFQYLDKVRIDSIFITDSIQVPVHVVETKEVNRLHNWQIILMCLGGVLVGYAGFWLIKKFR